MQDFNPAAVAGAVCVTGELRTAACRSERNGLTPMESLKKHVLSRMPGGYHVFAVVDRALGAADVAHAAVVQHLVSELRPTRLVERASEEYYGAYDAHVCSQARRNGPSAHFFTFVQAARMAECMDLVREHEGRRALPYRYVVRSRTDNLFASPIPSDFLQRGASWDARGDLCVRGVRPARHGARASHCYGRCSARSNGVPAMVGMPAWGAAFFNDIFFITQRRLAPTFFEHLRVGFASSDDRKASQCGDMTILSPCSACGGKTPVPSCQPTPMDERLVNMRTNRSDSGSFQVDSKWTWNGGVNCLPDVSTAAVPNTTKLNGGMESLMMLAFDRAEETRSELRVRYLFFMQVAILRFNRTLRSSDDACAAAERKYVPLSCRGCELRATSCELRGSSVDLTSTSTRVATRETANASRDVGRA